MDISCYLKRPESLNETAIYFRICYKGNQLKYYSGEKINPKFWNKDIKRARETKKFIEGPEFNTRLDNISNGIRNIYRRFVNDNNGLLPPPYVLKELLDKELKNINNVKHTFFSFFEDMIKITEDGVRNNPKTGKAISKDTTMIYKTVLGHLKKYEALTKRRIDFDTIDLDFYNGYTDYLINAAQLSPNTRGKNIKTIKLILNEATERGLNKNLAYKSKSFVVTRQDVESIYLTVDELKEIEQIDFSKSPTLDRVRDLFLIGCNTGLRFSDISSLSKDNIVGNHIHVTQQKTGGKVTIPILPEVRKILDKYNGELPRAISNQKTNEFLKHIAKEAPSLRAMSERRKTKGNLQVSKKVEKWELVTTHTARRSFATNSYLKGIPAITIMAITGHKTEREFMNYLKVTPTEHANKLMDMWGTDNKPKVIAL
jgi:integrase